MENQNSTPLDAPHKEALDNAKDAVRSIADEASATAEAIADGYSNGEDRPLAGYLRAMGTFVAVVSSAGIVGKLAGKSLPERIHPADFAFMAVATHKVARIIAKDAITSPLRAPFTRYEEPTGASELNESVRGKGWRHAVGELIECPFCLAVWVATLFTIGFTFAPRLTRWAATTFSAVAVSDTLQFGYDGLKQRSQ